MVYVPTDLIWMVVVGFIIAFVVAIGIGANDVANTFGTSVGSKVLTLRQACIMASICETAGSMLLGSKVTEMIRKGIVDVDAYANKSDVLILGDISALTGSCAWLLIATGFKMPVSGTHSIVGATVGFALVAHGTSGIDWKQLGFIVLSWFVSPVMSGILSVALFFICKWCILDKEDPLEPGLRFIPIFYSITIVVNFFSIFYDGPPNLAFDRIPLWGVLILSFGSGILTAFIVLIFVVPYQRKKITREVKMEKDAREQRVIEEAQVMDELIRQKVEQAAASEAVSNGNTPDNGPEEEEVMIANGVIEGLPMSSLPVIPEDSDAQAPSDLYLRKLMKPSTVEEDLKGKKSSLLEDDVGKTPIKQRVLFGRSLSGSGLDSEMLIQVKAFSDRYYGAHQKRLPADKSIALHLQERAARSQEKSLEEQGMSQIEIKLITRQTIQDKPEQHKLFSNLQILTAIFGGFAHGGNDVSNAIGPLVSIWVIATSPDMAVAAKAPVPIWILLYGGVGISVGLWIWGRPVIETMGQDLARITPSTGFCIEMGSAVTVLIASNLKFPISTTHCKVGSVVCVGWARAKKNVDWKLFYSIILAWVLTLPVAGGISAAVMACLLFAA